MRISSLRREASGQALGPILAVAHHLVSGLEGLCQGCRPNDPAAEGGAPGKRRVMRVLRAFPGAIVFRRPCFFPLTFTGGPFIVGAVQVSGRTEKGTPWKTETGPPL